ncbi:MAG TPA: Cys-tRNA(Pro) deacylase [Candidatus Binataceae bacterium]|nr:Cys-tRNA(Pro) deacylase [Candidatus Binataceae bacterium]
MACLRALPQRYSPDSLDIEAHIGGNHLKTNAARLLDSLGIRYELREYEVDPDDLAAESVARKIGLPADQVFKTLVVRGDRNGVCLAVVPGDSEVDEKALARLTGNRRVEMVPLKDVQPLTGYIRGGVTALAAKRDYPVYIDETMELFDQISISAGVRGTQILIAPADYLKAVNGTLGAIAREKSSR